MEWAVTFFYLVLGTLLLVPVASCAYWLGRNRPRMLRGRSRERRAEIESALSLAAEFDAVDGRLRAALRQHRRAVRKFAARLSHFERTTDVSRHELSDRADEMQKAALRLTADVSNGYAVLLQQMSHLSTFAELRTDPLTGAANRAKLDEYLNALLAEQTRNAAGLSLAMIDIDFFKQLNDSHSVLQGDRVLQELAALLHGRIRQCDLLARYGGEEFVVVMPRTELCVASELVERMRAAVETNLSITVSIGLAESAHGDTAATLFSRAEAALAKAKNAGRNCVYLHEGTLGRIVGFERPPRDTRPAAALPCAASLA
jgi:diguanylate cyclase (GGDEF)-like protein